MLAKVLAVVLVMTRIASADPKPEPDECINVRVGSPAERATLCTFDEDVSAGDKDTPVYRVQLRQKLRVVRGKKTVTLLDVVTTVTLLDKPRPDSPDLLNLKLDIARDGTSATLRDAKPGACDRALARIDKTSSEPWDRFDRQLIANACARRGRWIWSGTGFVRAPASRRSP